MQGAGPVVSEVRVSVRLASAETAPRSQELSEWKSIGSPSALCLSHGHLRGTPHCVPGTHIFQRPSGTAVRPVEPVKKIGPQLTIAK